MSLDHIAHLAEHGWQYLHRTGPHTHILDHRLLPEVSAVLAAMASRMPDGGIEAKYAEILEAIAREMLGAPWDQVGRDNQIECMRRAERILTEYPIHSVVQEFIDKNVRDYNHSSILELTSQPPVYVQGTSWFSHWLLFDNPLSIGQERSTRAIRSKNWPMCFEAYIPMEEYGELMKGDDLDWANHPDIAEHSRDGMMPHPDLWELHKDFLEVFEAEVEARRVDLQLPCPYPDCEDGEVYPVASAREFPPTDCTVCNGTGKKYPFIVDPQAFRPALDLSRWSVPGTIATGSCHAANLRVMARSIRDAELLAQRGGGVAAIALWKEIREAYEQALPGFKGMGLNEAVYDADTSVIPHHLLAPRRELDMDEVMITVYSTVHIDPEAAYVAPGPKSYVDPIFNHTARVDARIQTSLAVARDWHRHRTFYPWTLDLVWPPHQEGLQIHPGYAPISELGMRRLPELMKRATEVYSNFIRNGDVYRAMLALPFGTHVVMSGQAGLRDALYTFKLRAHARGASFEYEKQAKSALEQIQRWAAENLSPGVLQALGPIR